MISQHVSTYAIHAAILIFFPSNLSRRLSRNWSACFIFNLHSLAIKTEELDRFKFKIKKNNKNKINLYLATLMNPVIAPNLSLLISGPTENGSQVILNPIPLM